jgi:hypothetical protein
MGDGVLLEDSDRVANQYPQMFVLADQLEVRPGGASNQGMDRGMCGCGWEGRKEGRLVCVDT